MQERDKQISVWKIANSGRPTPLGPRQIPRLSSLAIMSGRTSAQSDLYIYFFLPKQLVYIVTKNFLHFPSFLFPPAYHAR